MFVVDLTIICDACSREHMGGGVRVAQNATFISVTLVSTLIELSKEQPKPAKTTKLGKFGDRRPKILVTSQLASGFF